MFILLMEQEYIFKEITIYMDFIDAIFSSDYCMFSSKKIQIKAEVGYILIYQEFLIFKVIIFIGTYYL